MTIDFFLLSKFVSHALRHEPWLYGLKVDDRGWVSVQDLLVALRYRKSEWKSLDENDLLKMIKKAGKRRHEIHDGKIRALYGHSYPGILIKPVVRPPEFLYHGTAPNTAKTILLEGLKPMRRQHVHLSINYEKAQKAGNRKANNPIILKVLAAKAYQEGIEFYEGNERIWLAKYIPPVYIEKILNSAHK